MISKTNFNILTNTCYQRLSKTDDRQKKVLGLIFNFFELRCLKVLYIQLFFQRILREE